MLFSATLTLRSHATSLPGASVSDVSAVSAHGCSAWLSNSLMVSASLCMASSRVGWGVEMLIVSSLGRYSPSDVAQSWPTKVVLLSTPLSEMKKIISILLFWLDFFRQSQYQNRKCWRCLPCEAFFYAQQRAVALRTAPRWCSWWPQCCARANFGGSKSPAFYWWFHHCCSCSFLRVFVQDSPRRTHIIRLKMVGQAGPEVCQNCTVKCTSIIMPLGSR